VRRVLVTHVDSLMGRRLAKALFHDPDVSLVFATGTGATPSFLDAWSGKCVYQRLDLAKARHVMSLFRSERFARARLDSVIHLPFVPSLSGERIPGKVSSLVSETRRLLEECQRDPGIARFVLLSSGFVYKPDPGNVNVVNEDQPLDFECEGEPRVRAWVDTDLVCQKELNDPALKTTILRAASIVTESGEFLLSPPLEEGEPPLGYDPMFSVVSDRDVARALLLALHGDRPDAYNIASHEIFPHSDLHGSREQGGGLIPIPGLVREVASWVERAIGLGYGNPNERLRYGMVLDTQHAEEKLGFEPLYRIEVRRESNARRIDTVRCR
jgi:nucleoside-diphosphate-sugar epimerase